MNRILALLGLILALHANAQKARLDSLQHALKRQPEANAERMNTLIEIARSYATIKPIKGLDASHEAMRLADRLNNNVGRAGAWSAETWNLYYLGRFEEADSVAERSEAAARRSGDHRAIARALIWVPWSWGNLNYGLLERGRQRMDSCFMLFRELDDRTGLADALYYYGLYSTVSPTSEHFDQAITEYERSGNLGGLALCLVYRTELCEPYVSDPELGLRDLRKAEELATRDGNIPAAMEVYGDLGALFYEKADYKQALKYQLKGLHLAEEFGDLWSISYRHHDIGEIYRTAGDPTNALSQYKAGLLDAPMGTYVMNCHGAGSVFMSMDQPDSAIVYLELARRANTRREEDLWNTQTTALLGEAHTMKGDTLTGVKLLTEALEICRKYPVYYATEITSALLLGKIHLHGSGLQPTNPHMGRKEGLAKAEALFEEALAQARMHKMLKAQSDVLLELSRLYGSEGSLPRALDFHQQYAAMKDSALNAEKLKAVANLQIQYETEKKEQQIVLLGKEKEVQVKELQKQKLVRNGFVGGFVLVALFAGVFLFQRNRISKARKRSDELLLNILPAEVAEELKDTGAAQAKHFDSATILFTDFKGFTQASERMSAQDLVEELNTCFKAFDNIITLRGIEKIKTIGDAYMCAGGLPDPKTSSPADVVHAALEMQAFMTSRKTERDAQNKPAFEMRVGIHTGPVVAGIVGVKKFQYDIWGDTVNTASRMESSGEVGQVNISEATYALVKDEAGLSFITRGKVQAKGKGEMEMYFVHEP